MRILVRIGHPAHVHFFKNFVWNMEKRGHQVLICASDKDVALGLLGAYGLKYIRIGESGKSPLSKIVNSVKADYRLWQVARKFKPDILTGIGSIDAAHASAYLRKPHICFDDSEPTRMQYYLYAPFTEVICSPSCFKRELGKKQVRYHGYHELAYLHPNYFKPDPSVLGELGLNESDRFIVVRFVAWQAIHDIGQHGFDITTKRKLIKEIEKYGRVLITSESPLPDEFEEYRITAPPEKMHDLLYYATLLIGDTQTMTTEAAVLGTPAIRCNSFVGPNDMGNFTELEKDYDLIYSFRETDRAIQKALELLQQPDLKRQWAKKRETLLANKIDVTQFMVELIENYPESVNNYRDKMKG